ncbi:MAG: hypothetical protein QM752_06475 [Gammaproteobacteria bacterium]
MRSIPKFENKWHRDCLEIDFGNYRSFDKYFGAYDQAFCSLLWLIEEKTIRVQPFALPLLFIMRHTLELGFKAAISWFSQYSEENDGIPTLENTHKLNDLFNCFKIHIKGAIKEAEGRGIKFNPAIIKEFDSLCENANELLNTLKPFDEESLGFRYHRGKDKELFFKCDDTLNLLDLLTLYDETRKLLYYSEAVFENVSYHAEIEKEYEEQIHKDLENHYGQV